MYLYFVLFHLNFLSIVDEILKIHEKIFWELNLASSLVNENINLFDRKITLVKIMKPLSQVIDSFVPIKYWPN